MNDPHAIHPFKLGSILLQYPTRALFEGLDALDAAAAAARPRGAARPLGRFLAWLRAAGPTRSEQHYVETFDLKRRSTLYLTYYRHGDTRTRGMAMLEFREVYRAEGLDPTDDELPDYLPMVLDFAASSKRGEQLLVDHRAALELLLRGLREARSPYADVVEAVCSRLPTLGRRELARIRKLWEGGPPNEDVGIEPFAPPDYLRGPRLIQLGARR